MKRFVASALLVGAVIVGGVGQAAALTANHLSAPSALAASTVSKAGWHYHRRCWWRHHRRHCTHWW
jgi:hypothetical protein